MEPLIDEGEDDSGAGGPLGRSLSYIPSLWVIITLGWNIIGPARRREERTNGDGGEDEGGARDAAAGSLVRSTEDGRDVPVHGEAWCRIGFCSTTSVVPSSRPFSVPYSCEYQNFSPAWYIFIWSHTCNLFSVQGQPAASNNHHGSPAHRRTSPTTHLADDLMFVGIGNTLWDNLVWIYWCW